MAASEDAYALALCFGAKEKFGGAGPSSISLMRTCTFKGVHQSSVHCLTTAEATPIRRHGQVSSDSLYTASNATYALMMQLHRFSHFASVFQHNLGPCSKDWSSVRSTDESTVRQMYHICMQATTLSRPIPLTLNVTYLPSRRQIRWRGGSREGNAPRMRAPASAAAVGPPPATPLECSGG